jgi:PAS domain S-box-containing protein
MWTPVHGWLHILSDLGVWTAYLAIPCVLGFFALRRRDTPFRGIFWLFGAFILACGTTHLMEAIIFWWPAYRLAGLIKLVTAMVSWATVIALVPIVPRALAMRSSEELEREIAERKRAEEALRESEERFRGTFDSAAVGIAHVDGRGCFSHVNETLCKIVGLTREDLLERTFADITHPDDRAVSFEHFHALMQGELPSFSLEKRYIRKDGSIVWGHVSVSLQRDAEGRPAYAIAVLEDISARKEAEEALHLASARLNLAVRGSNIGIWEIDMPDGVLQDGRVIFINLWEQFGYDRPDSPTDFATPMSLVHPDDRERLEQSLQSYLLGATSELEIEHRAGHKNGSFRWMLSRGVAVRDPAGRAIRLIGSSIDITSHKRAVEALRESEERFRGTFENAAVGIAHKDAEGRWLLVNQKYCEIVGYTREELLKETFKDITHPDDLAVELEHYAPLMRGELPSFSLEKRCIRKDGSIIWIDVSLSLQRDTAGRPAYAIAILQEISDRKRLEGELRQAKEAAESANRAKDEFLANVSHEIRTPMNAILGMTELALDTPLTDDQRQCLETVKSAADNLLCIINDLLDFSKIAAGKLELDLADFSLRTALGETLRALSARAHNKGLELICHVQSEVPDALTGDAGRLRQVLLNLVGNAIKFTDEGEVVVRVEGSAGPAPDGEVGLRFTVSDTGIGIPGHKLETIFGAFEQEDTSTTRKYGGTGLGLTIAARLVALMGGKITVESDPGRGSTFGFTARFGRQPETQGAIAVRPTDLLRNLRALIVDDNATNRHILEEWLRQWQMDPVAVGDGASAMDALWHGVALGRPFGLVLLDACMPGTSGLTLAAMIRDRAELSATRLIMLTSGDLPTDRARCRELHIEAHLLKPIPQDELLDTICRVMSRAEGETTPVRKPVLASGPDVTPLRILVAEDNEFNARHLERLLVRRGHSVWLANNGRQALAELGITAPATGDRRRESEAGGEVPPSSPTLNPCPPTPDFDVLLLDLHMPELDGFQVVQAIRERERLAGGHLPVIALTARSRKEDRERCLAAGMDEYLSKPVRAAELSAAIDRVVATGGNPGPDPSDAAVGTSLLDPVVLLATCGDDAQGLYELRLDFQTYLPARLVEVGEALRRQDAPRLREAAHKLFGLLSAFSTVAGEVASALEDLAECGQLDEAKPLLERLETMARELIREVDGLSLESLQRHAGRADGHDRTAGA